MKKENKKKEKPKTAAKKTKKETKEAKAGKAKKEIEAKEPQKPVAKKPKDKAVEKLKEIALDAARRAKETKQDVVLGNLTSWQRRVIHMALDEDKDVETQSQGEEPDRQLVIKPR